MYLRAATLHIWQKCHKLLIICLTFPVKRTYLNFPCLLWLSYSMIYFFQIILHLNYSLQVNFIQYISIFCYLKDNKGEIFVSLLGLYFQEGWNTLLKWSKTFPTTCLNIKTVKLSVVGKHFSFFKSIKGKGG